MSVVTTRVIKWPDLVRAPRDRFHWIVIPKIPVEVPITVTAKKTVESNKMDRMEKAATDVLLEYEAAITELAEKSNKRIEALANSGNWHRDQAMAEIAECKKIMAETNGSIKNALLACRGAINQAVEAALKKEAKEDKLLLEAQVIAGIKIGFALVTIGAAVSRLVLSAGAEITAYKSLVSGLLTLAKEVDKLTKSEAELQEALLDGIEAYLKLRSTKLMQLAQREKLSPGTGSFPEKLSLIIIHITKSGSTGKQKAKEAKDFIIAAVKNDYYKVEKAREAYRNGITKVRKHADELGAEADKLSAAMKAAKGFKDGIKIGALCMAVKRQVREVNATLDAHKKFLEASNTTMEQFGLETSDKLFIEKLKALDTKSIVELAKGICENLEFIGDLIG